MSWQRPSKERQEAARHGVSLARQVLNGQATAPPVTNRAPQVSPQRRLTTREVADYFGAKRPEAATTTAASNSLVPLFDVAELGAGCQCAWCHQPLERQRAKRSDTVHEYCDEPCRSRHRIHLTKTETESSTT